MKTNRKESSLLGSVRQFIRNYFTQNEPESLKDALEEVISEHEGESGKINPQEKMMISNILEFSEIKVSDVMTPRSEIVAVAEDMSLAALVDYVREHEHTRMPVYRENLDEIIGFIHIKDLMRYFGNARDFSFSAIMRNILAIPASMKVLDLLVKMRISGVHIAIVVDEYGGTDGLVTLEDLFEEIVGDIQDEHDGEEVGEFAWVSSNSLEILARIELEELEEILKMDFGSNDDEVEYHTLGGMLFNMLGEVPEAGRKIMDEERNIEYEIISSEPRKICKVRINLLG
jgi:magnesium and cobalt transporter